MRKAIIGTTNTNFRWLRSINSHALTPQLYGAKIAAIKDLTSYVKGVILEVEPNQSPGIPARPQFKPGQWIDLHIPNLPFVGGFSICSSPKQFQETNRLELAVKLSRNVPAIWVHKTAKIGDAVSIRVGGKCFFDPENDPASHLLLVSGGVGITPLMSILRSACDQGDVPVTLLYSARRPEDFVFRHELEQLARQYAHANIVFTATDPTLGPLEWTGRRGRINGPLLSSILRGQPEELAEADAAAAAAITEKEGKQHQGQALDPSSLLSYVCGPRGMIDTIPAVLSALGVPQQRIRFEKWW